MRSCERHAERSGQSINKCDVYSKTSGKLNVGELLPKPDPAIESTTVDEVEYDDNVDIEEVGLPLSCHRRNKLTRIQMGAQSGDPRFQSEWADDDDDDAGGPQCAQQ